MSSLNGTWATVKNIVASTLQDQQTKLQEQRMEQLTAENAQLKVDKMRLTEEIKELNRYLTQAGRKHREEQAELLEVKAELATEKEAHILFKHTVESLSKEYEDTKLELKRLQEAYNAQTERVSEAEYHVKNLVHDLAQVTAWVTAVVSANENHHELIGNKKKELDGIVLKLATEVKTLNQHFGIKSQPFFSKLAGKNLEVVVYMLQHEIDRLQNLKHVIEADSAHTPQPQQTRVDMDILIDAALKLVQIEPLAPVRASCIETYKIRDGRLFTVSNSDPKTS
jgi:DNA gyrase/topoisomerase IV subunit A